ncbi:putative LRR receptor-like serine/threonine-protein kinase EFR-like [Capsicum annuum]|uniref:Disease resistance R13L4/SHOC-2-like LRR domain-containing protein n=1 Tax=Capsicum annuum TaxID=4072 RepID=A0A2G3A6H9_CAPAN|nr:putative LRR receptor-like serine/threonine-protein kinase EFR-like [Capsicum annuum]KAF3671899.1 putative LRR receptor-like serine/threonine-protein kinase EFR-like [Capsicum annuum]PHT89846.1 hypothetical protein T459_04959 [Capsicum annuum]
MSYVVGYMPLSLPNCSKLQKLSLSYNEFGGPIHSEIRHLSNLQELHLANNHFEGLAFLTSLSNYKDLKTLALSRNPLNVVLPVSWGNLSCTSLLRFIIADYGIKGEIPKGIGNLSSLIDLDLSGNDLIGSIPLGIRDDLCKLQKLGYLHLNQNQLLESHPNCLGNLTSFREILLASNKLHSNIPASLENLKNLLKLDLSSNNLDGSLPPEIGNLKAMIHMDLSMNTLSNGIPIEIGSIQNLIHLSLRDNKLQGSIPGSLSSMSALEYLDLSHNNVSGIILKSLEKLQNLKYFNDSFNKLVGEILLGGPFKNISSQSFMSSEALCGSPRFRVPPCNASTSRHRSKRKKLLILILPTEITLVLASIAFLLVWIRNIRHKKSKQLILQEEEFHTMNFS